MTGPSFQRKPFTMSDRALQRELDRDRKAERRLWAKAALALVVPAVIIVVKVLFFP
jgi:hypothetical protein